MRHLFAGGALAAAMTCAALAQTVDAPLRVGGDVRAPKLLKHPDPDEPVNRGAGDESGESLLLIVIDGKGHIASAHLLKTSGSSEFDRNALRAVKRYVFEPATREGKPVAVQISLAMNFRSHRLR